MPQDYAGENPRLLAKRAERDLNSREAKTGHEMSDTALESGIDATAANKFPGAEVTYGSAASGAGDNREIPTAEGGGQQRGTGRMTKAGDFDEGEAGMGPEDVARMIGEEEGGKDEGGISGMRVNKKKEGDE